MYNVQRTCIVLYVYTCTYTYTDTYLRPLDVRPGGWLVDLVLNTFTGVFFSLLFFFSEQNFLEKGVGPSDRIE